MEQPLLRLGLLGFTDSDKQKVLETIANPGEGWPRWELVDFEYADAWCINGRSVERMEGNAVRVNTLMSRQPTISLNPAEISRPIAFTEPMPEGIETAEIVNFRSPQLMRVALQRFEAWLRPLRAQFALGSQLVSKEAELSKGIFHVLDEHGKLLAVVNFINWTAALQPIARPVDFENATWVHRPPSAADVPHGFVVLTVPELMWIYAVRTVEDALPSRYRKYTVYLRRLPRLPTGWLRDEHLVTLRALSTAPGKFADIQSATELSEDALGRSLAALYYAGAITTNRASAGHIDRKYTPTGDQSSLPPTSGIFASDFSHAASLPPESGARAKRPPDADQDLTAPAPFARHSRPQGLI
jgi:hypothetical protein